MQTSTLPATNRRRFYIITAIVLVAVLGSALFIVEYLDYSYANIQVLGNKETSFTISYDSTSTSLTPSENATVEVLPHANVTVKAQVASPYDIVRWDVVGVSFSQEGPDSINFVTGAGGSVVHIAVEVAMSNSSS